METPTHVNDEKSIVFASEDGSEDRHVGERDTTTDAESAAFEIESTTSPSVTRRIVVSNTPQAPQQQTSDHILTATTTSAAPASPEAQPHHAPMTNNGSPLAEQTPRESTTVHDDQSIHFDETSSVATSHPAHARPATTTVTDIEFGEEEDEQTVDLGGRRGDDEMSTLFAVAPTEDGSICFAAQSEKQAPRAATPEQHLAATCNSSSVNFAFHDEESKDLTTDTSASNALHQPKSATRRSPAVKPAEHVSPWNNTSVKSPHHTRYQPGKAATIEEQEWAQQHPMWTKPKGSIVVAKSPEATPLAAAEPAPKSGDYPYGQFGPRAKQYAEKLRREASEKSLRKSSSASLRDEHTSQSKLHETDESSPKNAVASPSASRNEARRSVESKARAKTAEKSSEKKATPKPHRQLKEQVEQWMKDHVPSAQKAEQEGEVSLSSGSSDGEQRNPQKSPTKSPHRDSGRGKSGEQQRKEGGKSPSRVGAVKQLPVNECNPPLTERSGNAPPPAIFEKLYHQGGKQAREAYIKEQQEREDADLKLKRLVMLYGVAKGQREFDRLYGTTAGQTAEGPKRSNTPPAWQRLYTTPTKRTASTDADKAKSQQRSAERGRPQSVAGAQDPKRRSSVASAKDSTKASPRPQTAGDDEIFSRLYKMGVSEMQRKQKLADEAEARRLKQEQAEIERGKLLARALRQKGGHEQMTREEYEAFLISQAEQAQSTEPKLSEDQLNAVYTRLMKQGKKKVNQALVDKVELKECTFHPVVNPSPTRGRSATTLVTTTSCTTDDSGAFPSSHRQRSPSCDKACLKLYQNAEKVRSGRHELHDKVDRERRLKLLKARMSSDHHFLRRVQLDPSVAEAFMAALPPQV